MGAQVTPSPAKCIAVVLCIDRMFAGVNSTAPSVREMVRSGLPRSEFELKRVQRFGTQGRIGS